MLRAAGMSLDRLSEKFGVSRDAIHRHMQNHVTPEDVAGYLLPAGRLADLAEAAAEEAGSTLDHLKILRSTLFGFMDRAARAGDTAAVTSLSTAILRVLRQLGAASGEITQAASAVININSTTNILQSPAFAELQQGMLTIAKAHPDARNDLIALCARLDAKYTPAAHSVPPAAVPALIDLAPSDGGAHG